MIYVHGNNVSQYLNSWFLTSLILPVLCYKSYFPHSQLTTQSPSLLDLVFSCFPPPRPNCCQPPTIILSALIGYTKWDLSITPALRNHLWLELLRQLLGWDRFFCGWGKPHGTRSSSQNVKKGGEEFWLLLPTKVLPLTVATENQELGAMAAILTAYSPETEGRILSLIVLPHCQSVKNCPVSSISLITLHNIHLNLEIALYIAVYRNIDLGG